MAYWLLKTEPDCYNWTSFQRDKKTAWDGITNALALKYLRTMQPGDLALFYHTGDERSAVGVAKVVSKPYPDPKEDDEKLAVVDVQIGKAFISPVSLAEMKADPRFAGWDLLRLSRLSVVPTSKEIFDLVCELGAKKE